MSMKDWNLEAAELEGERKAQAQAQAQEAQEKAARLAEDLAEERRYERIMSAERRHAEKMKEATP